MRNLPHRPQGSALIITLAILVIVTILAVGVSESARMNRISSNLYADRTWAAVYSEDALEQVVAKLQKNTADPERYWISQPGQLVVGGEQEDSNPGNGDERKILTGAKSPSDNPDPAPTAPRIVWLHSGVTGTTSFPGKDYLDPPNLNVTTFQDPATHVITNREDPNDPARAVQMRVRWNYLRKDGSIDIDSSTGLPSESPDLTNRTNPIVGRYAYWADDESAKVNYNLAWTRSSGNTTPVGDPSHITLAALTGFTEDLADSIHNQSVTRFYNTPEDARQLSADVATALLKNKFEVTHYNHDPDTTFFNQPRIVLTTQEKYAPRDSQGNLLKDPVTGAPYFLDILTTENGDPGKGKMAQGSSDIDETKLTKTLNMLNQYLSRTDWPILPGTSFQEKYYPGHADRLTQLSLNIIDYVRSKESAQQLVPPLRGRWESGAFNLDNYSKVNAFMGNSRNILITEVGLIPDTSGTNMLLKVELYAPKNYVYGSGAGNVIDLNQLYLFTEHDGAQDVWNKRIGLAGSTAVPAKIAPGEYSIVTVPWKDLKVPPPPPPQTDEVIPVRVGISILSGDQRLNVVPLRDDLASAELAAPVNRAIVEDSQMETLQVDDPRINAHKDDWKRKAATWGAPNTGATTLGNSTATDADIPLDYDAGKITDVSFFMPPPGGPGVYVTSVGELGYIHTGMMGNSQQGVPWRSLRLQPNGKTPKYLPDWALMDLFTVPVTAPDQAKVLFAPHDTAIGGRVNINAKAEPFGMERTLPLAAVLQGAQKDSTNKLSPAEASGIAKNIYNRTWADKGSSYGYTDGYNSPGEIAEVKGVAEGGEESEELIRQIANLITARGNVFSVYTLGQALKQTPGGRLMVTAENRQQAMIERYRDASTNKVRFRTVYSRPLSP